MFAVDRAGLVPSDGVTHHGIFDVQMMTGIPNMQIFAPDSYEELGRALDSAFAASGPVAVRYPKGKEKNYDRAAFSGENVLCDKKDECDVAIVTYSRLSASAVEAEKLLEGAKTVRLFKLFPIDFDELDAVTAGAKLIYVLEEGERCGGIGEKIAAHYGGRVHVRAIDGFVPHGDERSLDDLLGFTPEKVAAEIKELSK